MLNRLICLSRRPAIIAAALALAACACGSGVGWSRYIEPDLAIEGTYEWLDAYERQTGCLVEISTQGNKYRGWVVDDPSQPRECLWYGYELYEFEVQGTQVRVTVHRPYGASPYGPLGTAQYMLNLLPHVSLKGRLLGGSGPFQDGSQQWVEMTLVYLR